MQFIIDRNKPLPFNLNMTMIHDSILIILRLSNQLLLKSNQIRCVNLENWEATRGKQVHFDLRATFNLVLDLKQFFFRNFLPHKFMKLLQLIVWQLWQLQIHICRQSYKFKLEKNHKRCPTRWRFWGQHHYHIVLKKTRITKFKLAPYNLKIVDQNHS